MCVSSRNTDKDSLGLVEDQRWLPAKLHAPRSQTAACEISRDMVVCAHPVHAETVASCSNFVARRSSPKASEPALVDNAYWNGAQTAAVCWPHVSGTSRLNATRPGPRRVAFFLFGVEVAGAGLSKRQPTSAPARLDRIQRWSDIIAVAAQHVLAMSLFDLPGRAPDSRPEPVLHEILADPASSRMRCWA